MGLDREGEDVGLILVPCEDQVAAQAAANAQVLFAADHPDERALGVEKVTWDEQDGLAMRVWVQESQIVVLAVIVDEPADADGADRAFAVGAALAPALAASVPGEPVPPAPDGAATQGLLVLIPLAIWFVLVLPARAVVALRRPRYRTTSSEERWRDVTTAVTTLRTRRRWRRMGRWLVALGAVLLAFAVGNLAISSPLAPELTRGLVGAGMLAGGIALVRKNPAHPLEKVDRPPSTRGLRSWLGAVLSGVAYALAFGVIAGLAFAATASLMLPGSATSLPTPAEIAASGAQAWLVLVVTVASLMREALLPVLLGAVALLVAIAGLDALGRRLRAASLREVLDRDPRAPILYLRSFDEDRLTLPATLHRRGLMDTLNVVRRRRFEESIVVQLQRAGPVVAIAPPGTRLPRIGAARASYAHDEWQQQVTELAQRAAAVVLSGTPDSVREGFGWEIDLVANRLEHARVMVVVGPWRGQLGRRWDAFRNYVAGLPFFSWLSTAELPDGLLLAAHSSRWGWMAWGASRRTDFSYAVAIDHALHAYGDELRVDDDPDAVDPLLTDQRGAEL